ncbi:oxidoreductase [Pseudomonas sp. H9]|uniref:oxidoreductase n=1 Tax=Pseudomonas sp. H9 TaxID=483968 RepID=UPI00105791C9|nr:oxidoreductase [Pseudomonas sp. H9]TDF81194.1 SDR family oxidoreductase [Pseudomonas sp. H9]
MFIGKKFLIVGAAGLLGRKLVKHLIEQNALVVAVDIDFEKLQSLYAQETAVEIEALNLNDEQQVISFFGDRSDLDGGVNCSYPRNSKYGAHFYDVDLASFNENISLHLGGSFLLMQQAAVYFERVKTPFSLVNIASIYGVVAPRFDIYDGLKMTMPVEYAAIKSALIHLSKYVVRYVGCSDFRCNVVSPGGLFDHQPESFLERYKQHSLSKGMLDVEDVLGSIAFLLSDQSKYVNGQNLVVDDGFSL